MQPFIEIRGGDSEWPARCLEGDTPGKSDRIDGRSVLTRETDKTTLTGLPRTPGLVFHELYGRFQGLAAHRFESRFLACDTCAGCLYRYRRGRAGRVGWRGRSSGWVT